jgi:hypothetical protein
MIVFTITLRDRVAEVLAVVSFLVWAMMNGREQLRGSSPNGNEQAALPDGDG